mgnify:CR=1 FL=1
MRLQSAIFDMDGTLLDSMPTWRELGPTFLKEAGISATPEQDRMLHILADCDVIPYLREVCGLPWSQQEIIDQIIQRMYTETEENKDGLIIIGRCNPLALKKLNQKYRSVVSVNRNSTNYEVDEVLCDGKKIAQMAVEHLISLGHRNIGYVGGCRNEDRYVG